MTLHTHHLNGCAPEPLAHYLKALAILRLVTEQADTDCRGAWRNDRFVLLTRLTREELERFFLEAYRPTAFVAPWNKGSGFYERGRDVVASVQASSAPRFAQLREAVAAVSGHLQAIAEADACVRAVKAEANDIEDRRQREALRASADYKTRLAAAGRRFSSRKAELIPRCRATWRGGLGEWMSAVLVLEADGAPRFPALLGIGGAEGNFELTNNFLQRLADVFELDAATGVARGAMEQPLRAALWNSMTNACTADVGIAQFNPNATGGANSTTGADGDSLVNPWDFVLLMEGTVLFVASATRRLNPAARAQASAPFALRSHAAGSDTVSAAEESARGEQWMPLWDRFLSLPELRSLLAEGRAQVGRATVARPVDMARAISRLGVARGITAFQRFGYIERNGQSNFAVPLGRVAVAARPRARLVDDLGAWLDRLHRQARAKGAPSRLVLVERGLADAVFAVLTHDDTPSRWQAVLLAGAAVEQVQAAGTGVGAGPMPKLSPEWIAACDDGSSMFRLAAALGSAAGVYRADGRSVDPLRHHWLPLKPGARQFALTGKALTHDVRVVAHGRDHEADLIAVLARRAHESLARDGRHPQIVAAPGVGARLCDLAAWLAGGVDARRCVDLARAFAAIDWAAWTRKRLRVVPPDVRDQPDDAWLALRLNALPWALDSERDIPFDPAIARRLAAGDLTEAVRLSLRRLAAHGIRPALRLALGDAETARRWGAALTFPISAGTARQLYESLQSTKNKEKRHDR